jgi:hypothetical protein
MRMAPLLAEAQGMLRAMTVEAGIPLFVSRAAWTEAGAPSPAACLDDAEVTYDGVYEVIGAIADALLRRDDSEAFTFLLAHLADNGVVIGRGLQESLEKGMGQLRA